MKSMQKARKVTSEFHRITRSIQARRDIAMLDVTPDRQHSTLTPSIYAPQEAKDAGDASRASKAEEELAAIGGCACRAISAARAPMA